MTQQNYLESPIRIKNLRDAVVGTDWMGCINCDSITYYDQGSRPQKISAEGLDHRLERFIRNLQHALHGHRIKLVYIIEDYFDDFQQSYKAPHATIFLGRLPQRHLLDTHGSPEAIVQWLKSILERSGLKVKDNLIRLNFSDIDFWRFIADEQERKHYIWYETKRLDAGHSINNTRIGFNRFWINSIRKELRV